MTWHTKPVRADLRADPELDMAGFAEDPRGWFARQPRVGAEAWLLAHDDDGVVWGRVLQMPDGQAALALSSDLFPKFSPPLRAETLQQARLFGADAEVHVWRDGDGFRACRLQDGGDAALESFDERQILWGTRAEGRDGGFTLLADGRQGLRHAVPLDVPESAFGGDAWRPLRLVVRNYVRPDGQGQAYIAYSRLAGLEYVEVRK